ncbi:MAG TPA: hypothetical protein PKY82_00650 [Pyrinomonadaceae bacterium]|nr:hypothetical protein [Pyrinomonadaceae bacterium]
MELKRGHLNNQGRFVSFKMQKSVPWKSLLEFDYLHLLELDSQVRQYENYDFKIAYLFRGQEVTLHPNFVVQRSEQTTLNYLLSEKSDNDEQFQKLKLVSKLCKANGYPLEIIPEKEIRRQPRLTNAKIILKYAAKSLENPHPRLLCYQVFKDKTCLSLNELTDYFKQNSASQRDLFQLIYFGILSIDINQPIDSDSAITLLA